MKLSTFGLFKECFPQVAFFAYMAEMRRALADCRSCLDIGCGANSPVRMLDFDHTVGVEGHEPSLDSAKANRTHSDFRLARVQEIGGLFGEHSFDCVVGLDLIEHLAKEEGLSLIKDMERIASKKIILFTPNGFLTQESYGGDLQEHLSGWTPEEMRELGFTVFGMQGPKFLRGEYHQHRIRPRVLSGVLSVIGHYVYTRAHAEQAAAILCVKDVSGV
jgi:hypothetical protein